MAILCLSKGHPEAHMMRESMLAAIAGLALLCVGCEKGPAEKAGHKVDETVALERFRTALASTSACS